MADVGDLEERGLVDAARSGDADAWEQLYRHVFPRLRAYIARRAGAGLADDLGAETMARAVEAIHRFEYGPAGFDGWVFGIARRVVANSRRRAAREQKATARVGCEPLAEEPQGRLERQIDATEVRAAFARLRPVEQELLELRVVAGLSAEQAAAVLGKRPGAVRMAQSRALRNLRRLLVEEDRR